VREIMADNRAKLGARFPKLKGDGQEDVQLWLFQLNSLAKNFEINDREDGLKLLIPDLLEVDVLASLHARKTFDKSWKDIQADFELMFGSVATEASIATDLRLCIQQEAETVPSFVKRFMVIISKMKKIPDRLDDYAPLLQSNLRADIRESIKFQNLEKFDDVIKFAKIAAPLAIIKPVTREPASASSMSSTLSPRLCCLPLLVTSETVSVPLRRGLPASLGLLRSQAKGHPSRETVRGVAHMDTMLRNAAAKPVASPLVNQQMFSGA